MLFQQKGGFDGSINFLFEIFVSNSMTDNVN